MIGCFVHSMAPETGELFRPYVWGKGGFFNLFERRYQGRRYGRKGLSLILYMFYIEGRLVGWFPERLSLSNYSPKDQSIGVYVPVTRAAFHRRSDRARREFIARQIRTGLEMVELRMQRRDFGIALLRLRNDVENIIRLYAEPAVTIG